MKKWFHDILNLFFPSVCHICGNNLASHERFICSPCLATLPRTGYHRNPKNPMEERFAGQFPFIAATGHFFYARESSLSQLIQDMKYRSFPSIGIKLGKIAGRELFTSGFLNDVQVIVPLPMHFFKKAVRGFNQTDKIAEGISEASGIKIIDALKMTHQRKSQTSLSRSQRLANTKSLFITRKNVDLNDCGVLLVDDICTTGATMSAAAKALTDTFPSIRLYLFSLGVTF